MTLYSLPINFEERMENSEGELITTIQLLLIFVRLTITSTISAIETKIDPIKDM